MTITGLTDDQRAQRNARILRMAMRHVPPIKIARRIPGATHQIVNNVLYQARHNGVRVGRRRGPQKPKGHMIIMPGDIAEMIKPAAIARGCSVADLAKDILIAVADGGIVDAVLDDGVKSG